MATNNAINIATAATGKVLQGAGIGVAPVFSSAVYPSSTNINEILYSNATNNVTGIPISNRAVLTSSSAGLPSWTPIATNGQIIIGSTAGSPAAATLTAGAGITITNGSNSITIAAVGGGGGGVRTYTFISSATPAGGSIDFTNLDNTYKAYRFCLDGIAATGLVQFRASTDNLGTFATLDSTYEKITLTSPATYVYTSTAANNTLLGQVTPLEGYIDVYNIGEATLQIMFEWNSGSVATGTNTNAFWTHGTGQDSVREAINAIRFTTNTTNITGGTVNLYGIS